MAYLHNRHTIRLPGYDYSQPGAYFVTICAKNRENLFGDIENGEMKMNLAGETAKQCWIDIPKHHPHVSLDAFVIMPNHVHGILIIQDYINVGANDYSPLPNCINGTSKTIGSVIRGYKIGVTKWFRALTDVYGPWQRNYFETVIRSESELSAIRKYIVENPLKWEIDHENQKNCVNIGATRRVAPTDILFCI